MESIQVLEHMDVHALQWLLVSSEHALTSTTKPYQGDNATLYIVSYKANPEREEL